MAIDPQIGAAQPVDPVDYKWPGGDVEHFDRVWIADVTQDGKTMHVRHGLGRRQAFGRERVHSVTWVDDYPWLQATAVDSYDNTHELAGFVKLPDGTMATHRDQIPSDYGGVPIIEHSDVIQGPRRHSGLAFKLPEDDVRAWARCAVIRATLRQARAASGEDRALGNWDDFVAWAGRFYESPDFEPNERTYKTVIAGHLREARDSMNASSPDWLAKLQRSFGSPNNLTSWQMHDKFLHWAKENADAVRGALAAIWSDEDERIALFLARLPDTIVGGRGSRLSLASFLQMTLDEFKWPFYKPTPVSRAYRMAGVGGPAAGADESSLYRHFVEFLDSFVDEAQERGLTVRDRLDAQGLVWCLTSYEPPTDWKEEDRAHFTEYRDHALDRSGQGSEDLRRLSDLLLKLGADPDRMWLVIQGASYASERSDGYMQAPKAATDGRPRSFWTALGDLEEGDVVVHYARGAFRAVGTVTTPAHDHDVPGEGEQLVPGLRADVEYHDLTPLVGLDSIPAEWRQGENGFTSSGGVRQGYLFRLSRILAARLLGEEAGPAPPKIQLIGEAPTFEGLEASTLWLPGDLHALVDALTTDSFQVVLAGPPGTGKTWVAREVVRYLSGGDASRYKMVQFHPSYSYEQFIEGLRPTVNANNAISFERVDGIVLEFAKRVKVGGPDHFLIIDEMNRANLPRVLGELMYLFEYREQQIDLPYTPDFSLPAELRFIGTMNTADRSIRSIDVALRRRFDVFECLPDAGILSRYYARPNYQSTVPDLVDGFERLNTQLQADLDKFHTIGHTFFMSRAMTPSKLRDVWRRKLLPLIEEYFFDRPDKVESYEVEVLWPSLASD